MFNMYVIVDTFIWQVLAIEEIFKHRVTNVVFMGMGEPMMNLKSVLEAHLCLNKVHSNYFDHQKKKSPSASLHTSHRIKNFTFSH